LVKSLGLNKPNLYYTDVPFLEANAELIKRMTGLSGVREVESGTGLLLTATKYRCWLDVDSGMLKAYADKIGEQIIEQEKHITQLQARLANKSYVDNAPKAVVQQTKDQLNETKEALERLQTEHTRFQAA
jgi:valyl-tRNA synthetase